MPPNINGRPQIEGQRFSHHPPSDVIMLIMVHGRQLKEIDKTQFWWMPGYL